MPGNKRIIEVYAGSYRAPFSVSEPLQQCIRDNARIGVLRQNEQKLLAWFRKQPEPIRAEIILYGISQVIVRAKARDLKGPSPALAAFNHDKKRTMRIREKAKSFDRLVEQLDLMDVNGKLLGDCTRADLLRAAVQAEERAGAATLDAAMFREFAEVVGNGTLREATNRGKVVALLTHRFQTEEA